MRSIKLAGLTAAVTLIFTVAATATALAGGGHANPIWTHESGTMLFAKEKLLASVKAKTVQELSAPGVKIDCTTVSSSGGITLEGGEPGTDLETLLYTGCKVSGHPSCEVESPGEANGSIKTNPLKSTLAFKSKSSAEKEEAEKSGSVTVFQPASGTVFTEIALIGSCGFVPSPNPGKVKGIVVATNVQGAEPEEALNHTLGAVNQRNVFANPGAAEFTAGLEAFGLSASYKGELEVIGAEKFGIRG